MAKRNLLLTSQKNLDQDSTIPRVVLHIFKKAFPTPMTFISGQICRGSNDLTTIKQLCKRTQGPFHVSRCKFLFKSLHMVCINYTGLETLLLGKF